jgi:CxxC motif-containing protein
MKAVNSLSAPAVVRIGDILLENLLGTGANIVATANRG